MTQPLHQLQPIGFWSYARQDAEAAGYRLNRLREQLAQELQQVYGRKPVKIWQDVVAIPPGNEWEKSIDQAIRQSSFLIPIITPNFVESEWCCKEIVKFLRREAEINKQHPELRGKRRIFPILYIDIDDCDYFDAKAIAEIKKLQLVDFRLLRELDDDAGMRRELIKLAKTISGLLKTKVAVTLPATPTPAPAPQANKKAAEDRLAQQERDAEQQRLAAIKLAEQEAEEERQKKVQKAWRALRRRASIKGLFLRAYALLKNRDVQMVAGALLLLYLGAMAVTNWRALTAPSPPVAVVELGGLKQEAKAGGSGAPATANTPTPQDTEQTPAITALSAEKKLHGDWALEGISCSNSVTFAAKGGGTVVIFAGKASEIVLDPKSKNGPVYRFTATNGARYQWDEKGQLFSIMGNETIRMTQCAA